MLSFKEYLNRQAATFAFYHFESDDAVAETVIRLLLNEEKPRVDLGKGRSILFHHAHVPGTQDHLHFLVKGAKIAAVNADGSAHDRSHGIQLQRWALDGAAKHYPDFRMPKDGLIEGLLVGSEPSLLLEGTHVGEVLVPAAERLLAIAKAMNDSAV